MATQEIPRPQSSAVPAASGESGLKATKRSSEVNDKAAITTTQSHSTEGLRKRKESPCEDADITSPSNRRNPKRKATESAAVATPSAANQGATPPSVLLREALEPLGPDELQEWEGWCEVESEPAFFNAMLREMGVLDVKVQEVFCIEEGYVGQLPQPVYGFIFLYQYFTENYEDDEIVDDRDLWFANQTTANACATVAMANIIMNSDGLELGSKLLEFKVATQNLSTPLRGHALSSNMFIRSVHNSFTRRMDHLNVDLYLEGEATDAKKNKRRAPPKNTKKKKPKIDAESGFHFIAYVPANGSVWELDGLKGRPICLGPLQDGEHWTKLADPELKARMQQFEGNNIAFNLLALCKSPLTTLAENLARTMRSFELLADRARNSQGDLVELTAGEVQPLKGDDEERLAAYGLAPRDIQQAKVDSAFETQVNDPLMEKTKFWELYNKLATEQISLIRDYNSEVAALKVDDDRVKGRKKDHTPAIHCWLQKLTENGILTDWASDLQA
ncbi:Ubiquitin carboxyl-terminal hydrolase isozyme L5 [Colletotrichum sidae]|uniref:Ubiquitin carboxyl-terminal hydrolase n=2 Tax=Colletotrichum orbiculare species complex TaxID=2707354 RepID=A0A484FCC9_COLOR|nr:Ubiquitin carboxyl-terminal hydrolase isozyme L5 [Colletotrichum orbiculare MAFF 240422]TEA06086.1 Ubiquitin carboxyl-terminal hydrolase isozyme L5 [Colletotrichum sidae]